MSSINMPVDRQRSLTNTFKRALHKARESGQPRKKRKALFNGDDLTEKESDVSKDTVETTMNESGGSSEEADFTVNEGYARRFEYNKKREELTKCKDLPSTSDVANAHLESAGKVRVCNNAQLQG